MNIILIFLALIPCKDILLDSTGSFCYIYEVDGFRGRTMDKIVERSVLFDFYGNLLTEHQRNIYEDIVNNDYSLTEIGEEFGISRQGVHDAVKRIDKILLDYEDKLHCVKSYNESLEKIDLIKDRISVMKNKGIDVSELEELIDGLTEGL